MTKLLSQLSEDGIYVGPVLADESPLEPGIFLIPALAIDAKPIAVPEGKQARWANGWQIEDIPSPVVEEPPFPMLSEQEAEELAEKTRDNLESAKNKLLSLGLTLDEASALIGL